MVSLLIFQVEEFYFVRALEGNTLSCEDNFRGRRLLCGHRHEIGTGCIYLKLIYLFESKNMNTKCHHSKIRINPVMVFISFMINYFSLLLMAPYTKVA